MRDQTLPGISDSPVTVTLPREDWQALLAAIPAGSMTYTGAGVNVFNACQAIEQAVNPDPKESE